MQMNARVDVDVVALERDDEVTVMVELAAPAAAEDGRRSPAAVQVVLDRSGSMTGERLEAAQAALVRLVDRLRPSDVLGVVAFDDEVRVTVPAGALRDRDAARRALATLEPGGMTNLSGGLLRGIQEARRAAGAAGATLVLLSDGHANAGETDPDRLASVAARARGAGVTVSTVGIGLDYDDRLLAALARGGQGNHAFAEHGDAAAAAVAAEVDGLLSKTVQAASLVVRPDAPVQSVTLWNDLPAQAIDGGVMVELGDLWSAEERRLALTFAVPARAALGLARIATLELRWVTLPDFVERSATLPVHVNVVPGDDAAGRIPDPVVRTELVYQQVQDAKRKASDALRDGDQDEARAAYGIAADRLDALGPASASAELAAEREIVGALLGRAEAGQTEWAAKFGRMDGSRKSRTRGRRGPGL